MPAPHTGDDRHSGGINRNAILQRELTGEIGTRRFVVRSRDGSQELLADAGDDGLPEPSVGTY
jgi:hypothetical protein